MDRILAAVCWFAPYYGRRFPVFRHPHLWKALTNFDDQVGISMDLRYRLNSFGAQDALAAISDKRFTRECLSLISARAKKGWVPISRICHGYPSLMSERLNYLAPPLLWKKGREIEQKLIGVVGSRKLNPHESEFAKSVGKLITALNCSVVSGFAQGADRIASDSASHSVQFLPGGFHQRFSKSKTFLSLFPEAPEFDRISALNRNRYIYASAAATIVVSSRFGKGGAWFGAIESHRKRYCPIFVYTGKNASEGNLALSRLGAIPLETIAETESELKKIIRRPELKLAI